MNDFEDMDDVDDGAVEMRDPSPDAILASMALLELCGGKGGTHGRSPKTKFRTDLSEGFELCGGKGGTHGVCPGYHGTTVEFAKKIKTQGLKPRKGEVYVAHDEGSALSYALGQGRGIGNNDPAPEDDDQIAMVVVSKDAASYFKTFAGYSMPGKAQRTVGVSSKTIPPKHIKEVRVYRAGDVRKWQDRGEKGTLAYKTLSDADADFFVTFLVGDEDKMTPDVEMSDPHRGLSETDRARLDLDWTKWNEERAKGRSAKSPDVLRDAFDALAEIPRSEGVAAAEEAWQGGVADFGDPEAAYAVQFMPGYDAYHEAVAETLRSTLGETFTVWRAMSPEALEEWQQTGDVGPVATALSPTMASAWRKFAPNEGKKLVVVEFEVKPEHVVMVGKAEESELVIDSVAVSGGALRVRHDLAQALATRLDLDWTKWNEERAESRSAKSHAPDDPMRGERPGRHTPAAQARVMDYLAKETGFAFKAHGSLGKGKQWSGNDMDIAIVDETAGMSDAEREAYDDERMAEGNAYVQKIWDKQARGEITSDEAAEELYGAGANRDKLTQAMAKIGFTPTREMGFGGAVVTRYRNEKTKHTIEVWQRDDSDQGNAETGPPKMWGRDLSDDVVESVFDALCESVIRIDLDWTKWNAERAKGGSARSGLTHEERQAIAQHVNPSVEWLEKLATGEGDIVVFHGTTIERAEKIATEGFKPLESGEAAAKQVAEMYEIPWDEWVAKVEERPGAGYGTETAEVSTGTYAIAARWATHFAQGEVLSQLNQKARSYTGWKQSGSNLSYEDWYEQQWNQSKERWNKLTPKDQQLQRRGLGDSSLAPDRMSPTSGHGTVLAVTVPAASVPERTRNAARRNLLAVKEGRLTEKEMLATWKGDYRDIKVDPKAVKRVTLLKPGASARVVWTPEGTSTAAVHELSDEQLELMFSALCISLGDRSKYPDGKYPNEADAERDDSDSEADILGKSGKPLPAWRIARREAKEKGEIPKAKHSRVGKPDPVSRTPGPPPPPHAAVRVVDIPPGVNLHKARAEAEKVQQKVEGLYAQHCGALVGLAKAARDAAEKAALGRFTYEDRIAEDGHVVRHHTSAGPEKEEAANAAWKASLKAQEDLLSAEADLDRKVLEMLKVPTIDAGKLAAKNVEYAIESTFTDTAKRLAELTTARVTLDKVEHLRAHRSARGRYFHEGNGRIQSIADTAVMAHELGHAIDAQNPWAVQQAVEIIRNAKPDRREIRRATAAGEEAHVTTRLVRDYAFKQYKNRGTVPGDSARGSVRSTELLSTGLEHYLLHPASFAVKHPEQFRHVHMVMQNAR